MAEPGIASEHTHGSPKTSTRAEGFKTAASGFAAFLISLVALSVSFYWAGKAKHILGAGSLIGGGMMGYGIAQTILGSRWPWLKALAGIAGALLGVGATLLLIESLLGITLEV